MLPPMPCGHDQRFREVMFAANGCIACECEKQRQRADKAVALLDVISGSADFCGLDDSVQQGIVEILGDSS